MNEYYVYQLRVEDEAQPFYIGKGKWDRAKHHLTPKGISNGGNLHKRRKIAKALRNGKQVLVEFLCENITESEAFEAERFWIRQVGRADKKLGPLTNMTDGGEGLAGYSHTPETRAKLAAAASGEKSFWYGIGPMNGKTHKEETKALMSSKRQKENNAFYGKTHDEETRKRMRQIKLANPVDSSRFEGKTHSTESRAQIGDSCAKVLYEVTKPDGTVEVIRNMRQYCRDNSLTAPRMIDVANGGSKHHKGYKCRRVE